MVSRDSDSLTLEQIEMQRQKIAQIKADLRAAQQKLKQMECALAEKQKQAKCEAARQIGPERVKILRALSLENCILCKNHWEAWISKDGQKSEQGERKVVELLEQAGYIHMIGPAYWLERPILCYAITKEGRKALARFEAQNQDSSFA